MATAELTPPARPQIGRINFTIQSVRFRLSRERGLPDPRFIGCPTDGVTVIRELGLIPDDAREHFGLLMLNAQNRVLYCHEVSVGTLSASLVHPREVFGPSFRVMGIAALILFHNHPSGDPLPSREDLRLTRQLVDSGRL